MTLTADDVLNQKFTITKFRDGYDLDQVDDFLDSIVDQFKLLEDEKAALEAQVADLQQQLEAAQAQTEAQAHVPPVVEASIDAAPVPAAPQPIVEAADQGVSPEAIKSTAMLQLALEVHDKLVREGEEIKTKLITDAEDKSEKLVKEAQDKRKNELNELETERARVQSVIEDLRLYESEYRNTLRSYIEAQLKNLDIDISDKVTPEIH